MQVLVNLFDLGANVQAASDMARFSHDQASNRLEMESQLYNLVGAQLKVLGTRAGLRERRSDGRLSAIMITPEAMARRVSGRIGPQKRWPGCGLVAKSGTNGFLRR